MLTASIGLGLPPMLTAGFEPNSNCPTICTLLQTRITNKNNLSLVNLTPAYDRGLAIDASFLFNVCHVRLPPASRFLTMHGYLRRSEFLCSGMIWMLTGIACKEGKRTGKGLILLLWCVSCLWFACPLLTVVYIDMEMSARPNEGGTLECWRKTRN